MIKRSAPGHLPDMAERAMIMPLGGRGEVAKAPVVGAPIDAAHGERMPIDLAHAARIPIDPAHAGRMRRLVSEHYAFLWRSLRRLGVPHAQAEDAVQHVFIVAARKIGPVEEPRERAFLFAIALRVAADERRSLRRHPEDPSAEHAAALRDERALPDEQLDQQRARAVADALIAELPLELRAVFVLAEIEEMTAHAIADMLSLPRGTVASRLRRARELFEAAVLRYQARAERRGPR